MQGTTPTWVVVKKTEDDFQPILAVNSKRSAYMTLELLEFNELNKDKYEVVRLPDL